MKLHSPFVRETANTFLYISSVSPGFTSLLSASVSGSNRQVKISEDGKRIPTTRISSPYPGPPMNYGGAVQQPGMYPQPAAPPPAVYQGGVPFNPAMAAPGTTVTHLVVTPALHEVPGQAVCPHCQQTVITNIERTAGLMTWAICGGLALFGCFLCCCIPFCVDSCQDVAHHCPSCQKVIYVYKRL